MMLPLFILIESFFINAHRHVYLQVSQDATLFMLEQAFIDLLSCFQGFILYFKCYLKILQ